MTISNQFESYYRFGNLDACEGKMGNIYTCLKAKTKKTPAEARRVLLTELKVPRPKPEPVWKLKEKPSWE